MRILDPGLRRQLHLVKGSVVDAIDIQYGDNDMVVIIFMDGTWIAFESYGLENKLSGIDIHIPNGR